MIEYMSEKPQKITMDKDAYDSLKKEIRNTEILIAFPREDCPNFF